MNRAGIYCFSLVKKTSTQHFIHSRITQLFFPHEHQSFIHTSSSQLAGHNKWSKIKRKKAVADTERSQYTHKYIQKIISAIKVGGSSDPEKNLKLASIVDQAKSAGVPKTNIESAVKKASSKGESGSAESVLLNGRGPGGSLLLIEALTDNIRRTRPQIRTLLEKRGAYLGEPGSSLFIFEHKALVQASFTNLPPNTDPLELAIEVGAEDVSFLSSEENESQTSNVSREEKEKTRTVNSAVGEAKNGDSSANEDLSKALGCVSEYQFKCDVSDLRQVLKSLKEKGVEKMTTRFEYLPKTYVDLSEEEYERACELVEAVCEHEEVVEVYSNFVLTTQS